MTVIDPGMQAEARKARRWHTLSALAGLGGWALSALATPLVWELANDHFGRAAIETTIAYLQHVAAHGIGPVIHFVIDAGSPISLAGALGTLVGLFAIWGAGVAIAVKNCPYRNVEMIHGDARFADARDLAEMDEGKQIGPSGQYLHLGYAKATGVRIGLIETLSVLGIAPPGTGKTARLVVPGVLGTDESCFLVHDPKPELWEICSGHRSKLGPCFRMDWGATDTPDKGVFHPKFNFLDSRIVPPQGPARDTYIDSLGKVLVAENKGENSYFTNRGRATLIAMVHYLLGRINDAPDNPDRWKEIGLPERWHGKEASFPMLVDYLTYGRREAEKRASQNAEFKQDPAGGWINEIVDDSIMRGLAPRIERELNSLIRMADKERSGLLGEMEEGIAPFKNGAVSERTEAADFMPSDFSGRIKAKKIAQWVKEGIVEGYPRTREEWETVRPLLKKSDWEPVTVFICLNQAEAPAFERITALFFEVVSRELLTYGPNEITRTGSVMGPFPTCFLMDELVKFGKCNAVIDGPDLGRSKKRYYVLIAQDIAQIKRVYSEEQKKTILSTAAVRFILPQNSPETIEDIQKTVGKTTVRRKSVSRQVGLSKSSNPFAGNLSMNIEGTNLLNVGNLTEMPKGHHLLIVQGKLARPIWCRSALYFSDPEIAPKAYNPRLPEGRRGPLPAIPLPEPWYGERLSMWAKEKERQDAEERALRHAQDFFDRRYRRPPEQMRGTPHSGP